VEPGTITVRGTATAPGRPDDLRIALLLATLAPSPEAALDGVTDRSTSAVTVAEVREWDGDRQVSRGSRPATST
jgi:hypothetical protein